MKYGKWLLLGVCLSFVAGCGSSDAGVAAPNRQQLVGYGEACGGTTMCREALSCQDGTCQPEATAAEGEPCTFTGNCLDGLYCDGTTRVCTSAGGADVNQTCGDSGDCKRGLLCVARGFSGSCQATGDAGVGVTCSASTDCAAGLNCLPKPDDPSTSVCSTNPMTPPQPFTGVQCAPNDDSGARAFFELPGGDDHEFYRLPFPNDIRIKDGHPDMSGHPTPGPGVLGYDIVQRYLDAISTKQDRFGLSQTVYFRFSANIDFDTLKGSGDSPTLEFVNIDANSPGYNRHRGMSWRYSTGKQRYMCQNWLTVRPETGRPLTPDTTYAVVMMKGVKDTDGGDVTRDSDFDKIISPNRPADFDETSWDAYQPLRDWLSDQGINPDDVLDAAVFTTGNPLATAQKLADAAAQSAPTLSDATLCDDGVTSPCDDGLSGDAHIRGCFGANPDFAEIQGKLSLPIFQEGQPPYLDGGGDIAMDGDAPKKVRDEKVCTAITVPKTTMPQDGWPVLIYAHGTGGSFRSHVGEVSPMVSKIDVGGTQVGMVVVGWDQVLHGTRRGDSQDDPEGLVYNYANPLAARGNFLQGAADIHAIVAWAKSFDLPAAQSPTGEEIKLDPTKIYFMGHSQGGTTGPIALPYNDSIAGAVLSGSGAELRRALLAKTSPINAKAGLMVALQDPKVGIDEPVVSLLQGFFDPVDPLNYAQFIVAKQIDGQTHPTNVFHLYGKGDTYTPPHSLEIMVKAMRIPYVDPFEFDIGSPKSVSLPVSANMTTGGKDYTAFGRQYTPDGYDGHFVAFRNDQAKADIAQFFGTAVADGVPTVGQ